MPTTVPIEIFRIGRTQVDREEVARWMKFIGADQFEVPDDGAVSNPALLIALAGKRCYRSFQPGLNPNVTKIRKDYADYFDNILSSGHGCYDAETEVLTSVGWMPWPDVTKNDLLATLDHDGGLVYVKPVALTASSYTGKMYRVETQGVDLLVTPNHKMYVCPTTTQEGRKREKFQLIEAATLGGVSHAYTKVAETWVPREPISYSMSLLRLVGFAIGDGHYSGGNILRFRLRRPRKVAWLKMVVRELAAEQVGQWALRFDGEDRYTVDMPLAAREIVSRIYQDGEKCIPQFLLMTATRDTLEGLLEGLMQSDGHEGSTGNSYDTTSPVLAGQVQQLCLHCGIAANVCYTYGPEDRPASFGSKPLIRLSILSRSLKPEVNKHVGQVGRTSWVENWTGEVFCAQMPDDTRRVLYVRRNGQPVWCGNSVLEHSVFTFAIENVSRVFTAEMNRHRAGWAISEGSLRFIRFGENVPYWLPDSIKGPDVLDGWQRNYLKEQPAFRLKEWWGTEDGPKVDTVEGKKHATRLLFEVAFGHQEEVYRKLELVWADELRPESKFKGKKEITSMMRRIIGMGVATGGVWSGNVRGLRHVLTMRCSPQAEEEILHVFSRVVKRMRDDEPFLFGDFTETPEGWWVPKYVKV